MFTYPLNEYLILETLPSRTETVNFVNLILRVEPSVPEKGRDDTRRKKTVVRTGTQVKKEGRQEDRREMIYREKECSIYFY